MLKKNIIILFLIVLLSNCGFTPIYIKNNNTNFSIEKMDFTGDRELNNFLKSNLNQYKNKKVDNKIYIEAVSIYEKNILSKNRSGEVTKYQLEAKIVFKIKPSNKEIKITEKKIMNSMSDKFEEARYERLIKQSFASSISNKLSSKLISN
jgi:outer membrane lipopolysaccharide assembly protein LptE/RlpB